MTSSRTDWRPGRQPLRVLAGVTGGALVAATAIWLASAFAAYERTRAIDRWQATLGSMANDRQAALERWVAERRGDASVIAAYPTTQSLVGGRLAGAPPFPPDVGAAAHLADLLDISARAYGYLGAWVIRDGEVVAASRAAPPLDEDDVHVARELLVDEHPAGGFVRRGGRSVVYFAAPVGGPGIAAGEAAVLLAIDPADYLFRLLMLRPFASDTLESLLVARDGDAVVLLGPLPGEAEGQAMPRRPIGTPELAAVEALAGAPRFGEYVDYRGERVFAATRPVSGTPWGLVVKVARREVFADYRRDAAAAAVAAGAVVLVAIGLAFGIWRRERAKGRLALLESEARLGALLDQSGDVILTTTPEGRILEANRRAVELYGYTLEELRGMSVADLRAPDVRASLAPTLALVRATSRGLIETVHVRKDGTHVPVEGSLEYVRQESGDVIVGVVRDITARKIHEAALAESEARFRRLAENAQDLIFRYRFLPERGFEYVSPVATAMTGYTPDEHYADPDLGLTIVHPDDRALLERASTVFEGGEGEAAQPVTVRWIRKDGSVLWTEIRNVPIRDEQGRLVAVEGIARDVTRRIEAERTLDETRQQLAQSQKIEAIGRLAAGVAHDFNNLLTVISGYADLIQGTGAAGAHAEELEQIQTAAGRAAGLTRQLLAFSRQQVLEPRVLSLNTIIDDVAKLLERVIGEDVTLAIRLDPALGNVEVDQAQIEQVLLNLAVNARDAMPGGGTLAIETANVDLDEAYVLDHPMVSPGPYVLLVVSDTGVGMDAATRVRAFEPFFTTKAASQGSGLGLATVYGVVKQSGGFVWLDSEVGHGTAFKIYLPRVAQEIAPTPAPPAPARAGGGETVLVVEDQPMLRGLITRVLEREGYRIEVAATGSEALARAEALDRAPDLLLTDVVLPDLGGVELGRRLADTWPGLRVLFVSGYAFDALDGGAALTTARFLPKPFSPRQLLDKIREVLAG